jgi:hypothetical protein
MVSNVPLSMPSGLDGTKPTGFPRRANVDKSLLADNGHWLFDEPMGGPEYIGFVYALRNKADGTMYLGQKLYRSQGAATMGKESNWKYYFTSNKMIDATVRYLQQNNIPPSSIFQLVCLEQYKTKGCLSFAETWILCMAEVPCYRKLFHNTLINGVSWPCNKEQLTDRMKVRLRQFLAGEL